MPINVTLTRPVATSADHAFDVVVRHQADNHPRWEDEVVEVRPLDDIVGVGHRSVMVRHERGRTREVVNECVEYVDGARAAYSHVGKDLDFWIAFDFARQVDSLRLMLSVRELVDDLFRLVDELGCVGGAFPAEPCDLTAGAYEVA